MRGWLQDSPVSLLWCRVAKAAFHKPPARKHRLNSSPVVRQLLCLLNLLQFFFTSRKMALEIVPEFLHFKQSIPVAGHDFCITGQEAIVELLEGLEMSRGWQIPHLSKKSTDLQPPLAQTSTRLIRFFLHFAFVRRFILSYNFFHERRRIRRRKKISIIADRAAALLQRILK